MAFVNEEIPPKDKAKIDTDKMKKMAGIYHSSDPYRWAIDRERDVFLIFLRGGSPEIPTYYSLCTQGEIAVFNVSWRGEGNKYTGVQLSCTVSNLRVSEALQPRINEIKQLIREALDEHCQFADRSYVTNVNIEFQ